MRPPAADSKCPVGLAVRGPKRWRRTMTAAVVRSAARWNTAAANEAPISAGRLCHRAECAATILLSCLRGSERHASSPTPPPALLSCPRGSEPLDRLQQALVQNSTKASDLCRSRKLAFAAGQAAQKTVRSCVPFYCRAGSYGFTIHHEYNALIAVIFGGCAHGHHDHSQAG